MIILFGGVMKNSYIIIYFLIISAVAVYLTIKDKAAAKTHSWRVPEATLMLVGLFWRRGGNVCHNESDKAQNEAYKIHGRSARRNNSAYYFNCCVFCLDKMKIMKYNVVC